jgi:hypothetical protein
MPTKEQEHLARTYGQLKENLSGDFWKGADIPIAEEVVIGSGQKVKVPVILDQSNLPPLLNLYKDSLRSLNSSTRSRYAQLGLEIGMSTGFNLSKSISENEWYQLQHGLPIKQYVDVESFCYRPIYLPKGAHLFRLYTGFSAHAIKGADLEDLIDRRKIRIEGTYGDGWQWDFLRRYAWKTTNRINDVMGIKLKLDPQKRWWIPPDPLNRPIVIDDVGNNYRLEIDKYLYPVPSHDLPRLWIGETNRLTLPNDVVGLLSFSMNLRDDFLGFGTQTNSRLIDPGTDEAIRVEMMGPTLPKYMPEYVELDFTPVEGCL